MKQNTTTTGQKQQLDTQRNVEDNHNKNYPLIERERIENTPFVLIGQEINDNKLWFMVCGDYMITEPTETKDEQIQKLETEKWMIITTLCTIIQTKGGEYDKMSKIEEHTI